MVTVFCASFIIYFLYSCFRNEIYLSLQIFLLFVCANVIRNQFRFNVFLLISFPVKTTDKLSFFIFAANATGQHIFCLYTVVSRDNQYCHQWKLILTLAVFLENVLRPFSLLTSLISHLKLPEINHLRPNFLCEFSLRLNL